MNVKQYQPEEFSTRLHEAYIKSGLEITEISKRTKIARSSVYGYMYYGVTPNITALAKLSTLLNVSADYLLFGKEG